MESPVVDSDEIDALNYKSFVNISRNVGLAVELNNIARESSLQSRYRRGEARSLLNSGFLAHEEYKINKAFDLLNQAHRMFLDMGDDFWGLTASYNLLGLLHIRKGEMEKAFSSLQQGLDLSREHNETELEAMALSYIGICQYKAEKFQQSLEFFYKALKVKSVNEKSTILHNLGCTYRALEQYDDALDYQKQALKIAELEDRWSTQVVILEEMGLIYQRLGDEEKSESTFKSALARSIRHYRRSFVSINICLAELYISQKRLNEAESSLLESFEWVNETNELENRKIYLISSQLYELKGDLKRALLDYKKYHALQTSVLSSKIDEKVWLMKTEKLKEHNSELKKQNKFDSLTGIYNRKEFFKKLNKRFLKERRKKSSICILLIDIDFFKKVNDTRGHQAGDFCLVNMGKILGSVLHRDTDFFGRYGGEEFIVSMIDMSFEDYALMGEKIRSEIENKPAVYDGCELNITVSIGMSIIKTEDISEGDGDIARLINEADRNLYISKNGGRNRVRL